MHLEKYSLKSPPNKINSIMHYYFYFLIVTDPFGLWEPRISSHQLCYLAIHILIQLYTIMEKILTLLAFFHTPKQTAEDNFSCPASPSIPPPTPLTFFTAIPMSLSIVGSGKGGQKYIFQTYHCFFKPQF